MRVFAFFRIYVFESVNKGWNSNFVHFTKKKSKLLYAQELQS